MQSEAIWIVNQDEDDRDLITTILKNAQFPTKSNSFRTPVNC